MVVRYLYSLFLSVGKAPDPGDSFSVRTESASTVCQSTAEKRNYSQTPNNSVNSKSEAVKRKGETASSIKAKLDDKSGIDEKIQQECRQVIEMIFIYNIVLLTNLVCFFYVCAIMYIYILIPEWRVSL